MLEEDTSEVVDLTEHPSFAYDARGREDEWEDGRGWRPGDGLWQVDQPRSVPNPRPNPRPRNRPASFGWWLSIVAVIAFFLGAWLLAGILGILAVGFGFEGFRVSEETWHSGVVKSIAAMTLGVCFVTVSVMLVLLRT